MNTYSFTYWPPAAGTTNPTGNICTIDAVEFAFTDTHLIFMGERHEILVAIPLSLSPIVRLAARGA